MNESKSHIRNITKVVAEICKQKNSLYPPTALPVTEKLFSIRSNIVDLGNLYELNISSKSLIRKVLRKQNGFKTKIKKKKLERKNYQVCQVSLQVQDASHCPLFVSLT